ncbi:MAG: tetratricopeptide repeat protein [Mediterranea sp.]|jgi:tetratricopeptide (TPR) repeat protein|nr:tetratricopeptide repeat protein [Mediterranea sp.]
MNHLNDLKELINQGDVDTAIERINHLLRGDTTEQGRDTLFYLLGNAYRKKGDWKRALDNYQRATDINPHSPAAQARAMAMDILEFFNKDMYNQ